MFWSYPKSRSQACKNCAFAWPGDRLAAHLEVHKLTQHVERRITSYRAFAWDQKRKYASKNPHNTSTNLGHRHIIVDKRSFRLSRSTFPVVCVSVHCWRHALLPRQEPYFFWFRRLPVAKQSPFSACSTCTTRTMNARLPGRTAVFAAVIQALAGKTVPPR